MHGEDNHGMVLVAAGFTAPDVDYTSTNTKRLFFSLQFCLPSYIESPR
jgi:hypothetical protein